MFDFSKKYEKENFDNFLVDLLPEDVVFINKDLKLNESFKYFEKCRLVAEVISLNDLKIIEIKHNSSEKSRVTISKDLFRLLSYFSYLNALIITYSENEKDYRLSLVTSELNWITDDKIKKDFSDPKRLSFLLGPNSKIHTPTKQLIRLGKVKNFQDLNDRFNIEVVSNEFFDDYKNLFLYLKKYLDEDKEFSKFAKKIKLKTSVFAKKLLGQIVFCYFLQKKGWLTSEKNKNFGSGDQLFLRNKFNHYQKKNENFFNNFLEYFFYEGLNKKNENDYIDKIKSKVPYIGGGLFEYYEGYDWKKETLNIPNKTFSNKESTGILDIFDLYNFTVDENEDLDIEISIDPEMLGRVFENLLEENIKKQGGTYYTPRIIVQYMCEESIISFLINKKLPKISNEEIISFVKNVNFNISKKKNFLNNIELLDNFLVNIKICDPAMGSGAFAVSIMNLVVKLRLKLINFVKRKYKNNAYYFKRDFIQNNIYGVDIDESAVEIAKLRLWLSLILDENEYSQTETLPNLDFKIIQGNSLLETFEGINLGSKIFEKLEQPKLEDLVHKSELENHIKNLATLQNKFLNTVSYSNKKNIKQEIENLMLTIFNLLITSNTNKVSNLNLILNNIKEFISPKCKKNFFPWGIFFADVFYFNKGFDLVISNPPYISTKEISKFNWRKELENCFGFVDDLYNHFTFLATYIAKDDGIISFITSDTFMTLQTKHNMRKLLLKYNLYKFINTPKAFKAMVDTSIFFLQKKISNGKNNIDFINLKNVKLNIEEIVNKNSKIINWEKALKIVFKNIQNLKKVKVSNFLYSENINSVFFIPNEKNLKIRDKLIPKVSFIYKHIWNLIKTSRDIKKNKKEINFYTNNLKEGDVTLLGLITDGGQGLATGNNGDFIGCIEGSNEAKRVFDQRPNKIFELIKNNKNFLKKFNNFSSLNNLDKVKEYFKKIGENEIRSYFFKIKKEFGRDIFGQGFLYKVISKDEIKNIDELSDKEKKEGLKNGKKNYVMYDKGDKEGNRWFMQTPYYIKWDANTVNWFVKNSGKKEIGMPVIRNKDFYFKKGFCWSDVHTVYLKCRLKEKSVYDVKSMSMFVNNKLFSDKYIVCIINSKFISEFQQNFLNNTSSFQINDARKLPIVVPSKKTIEEFDFLFDEAKKIKLSYFKNIISDQKHFKELEKIQTELDTKVEKLYNL